MEVIQKIIARSGQYSRREAEALIRSGKVGVDGVKAKLGDRAEANAEITISGKPLQTQGELVYYKLNKPKGYVCTTRIFRNELNIFSLLPTEQKLAIVGRLDKNSRGLVILTNDGSLVFGLTHPSQQVKKEYHVKIQGEELKERELKKLLTAFKTGIDIGEGDGLVWADEIEYIGENRFRIFLSQGRKRQIRRMMKIKGYHVTDLKRLSIAGVMLGSFPEGQCAPLSPAEVAMLKEAAKEKND